VVKDCCVVDFVWYIEEEELSPIVQSLVEIQAMLESACPSSAVAEG
jgi:hypothetical protein